MTTLANHLLNAELQAIDAAYDRHPLTKGNEVNEKGAKVVMMRNVGDRMIIAPPLTITPEEIDILIDRARQSLDECLAHIRSEGMFKAA